MCRGLQAPTSHSSCHNNFIIIIIVCWCLCLIRCLGAFLSQQCALYIFIRSENRFARINTLYYRPGPDANIQAPAPAHNINASLMYFLTFFPSIVCANARRIFAHDWHENELARRQRRRVRTSQKFIIISAKRENKQNFIIMNSDSVTRKIVSHLRCLLGATVFEARREKTHTQQFAAPK